MKCKYILVAVMLLMLTSCVNKDRLPEDPRDKQEYVDTNGNRWIYDYALMRWAMTPTSGPSYYYYPRTDRWTNTTGASVAKPSVVHHSTVTRSTPSTSTSTTSRPTNTGRSFGSSHSTSSHGS